MKKVIVVGNGLQTKDNGKTIDSFDIVIRLNCFATKGYEKKVGTKLDVWGIGSLSERMLKGDLHGDCDIWALYPYHSRGEMVDKLPSELQKRIVRLDTRIMWSLNRKLRLHVRVNGKFPTTGLSALEYCVAMYGEVYYTGFTFEAIHYFDNVVLKTPPCHDQHLEKLYVTNHKHMKEL